MGTTKAAPTETSPRFGVVFLSILATLVLAAAVGSRPAGRVLIPVLLGGTLLLTLRAAEAPRRTIRLAIVAIGVMTIIAVIGALAGEESTGRTLNAIVICVLVAASPVAIARRLTKDTRITAQTVLGALCIYLMLGLLFASVFSLIGLVSSSPFFVQQPSPQAIDYLYFSLVTLTTVGYGDLTAAGNLGRMLASTEALIGQLYLVSVVALVVGNIGRTRRRFRDEAEPPAQQTAPPDDGTPGTA